MKFDAEEFKKEVYNIVASIPKGKVVTYGQIAWLIGKPQHSRMVGHTLHDVPQSLNIPCHRVVNSQGKTAPCWIEQRKILESEGVTFKPNGCVYIKIHQWQFQNEIN